MFVGLLMLTASWGLTLSTFLQLQSRIDTDLSQMAGLFATSGLCSSTESVLAVNIP